MPSSLAVDRTRVAINISARSGSKIAKLEFIANYQANFQRRENKVKWKMRNSDPLHFFVQQRDFFPPEKLAPLRKWLVFCNQTNQKLENILYVKCQQKFFTAFLKCDDFVKYLTSSVFPAPNTIILLTFGGFWHFSTFLARSRGSII